MANSQSIPIQQPRRAKIALFLLLLLSINIVSALGVIYTTYCNRQLFAELQKQDKIAVNIEARWGRLLLENSSLGAYSRIESIASKKLNMKKPTIDDTVLVEQ